MKKAVLLCIVFSLFTSIKSEIRYNAAQNITFYYPFSPSINQKEFCILLIQCAHIETRIRSVNPRAKAKDIIRQCMHYLGSINSYTAKKLRHDIKNNSAYYADGTYMGKLFI